MAEVTIDIPGIGPIEAQNAASESTLKEIAKLLGAKSGSGTGGMAEKVMGKSSPLGVASKQQAGMMGKLGSMVGKTAGSIAKMGGPALAAAQAFIKVGEAAGAMLGSMSALDKNVSGAADQIPIIGGIFKPAIDATEKMVNAFQGASGSGASFGGQLVNLTNAAATAGMTVDEYTKFVRANGDAFRLLGGDVETGRKRFTDLSKEMRTSGFMMQLNTLGYTSTEVNEGMAKYSLLLGRTGKQQNMSTAELASRSANYMKEIDKLAKATGQEREQIEENQAKLLADAQFQAKVANMGVDEADALRNTITGLPEGLQGVAKDIIATGTATTKESEEFAALMPRSYAMMQKFAQITENGGTITAKQRNELNNLLSQEGKLKKQQFRDQGRFNDELGGSYMRIVEASNIQTDALNKATDAQEEQIAVSDQAAAGFESMRRRVNEIAIEFTNLLASTGLLDSFMRAFEFVGALMRNVVAPAFKIVGSVVGFVADVVSAVLTPPLQLLGFILNPIADALQKVYGALGSLYQVVGPIVELVGIHLKQAFYAIWDTITNFVRPVTDFLGRMFGSIADFLKDTFGPMLEAMGGPIGIVKSAFSAIGGFINDYITPVFETLYNIAIAPVVNMFQRLRERMAAFFDMFSGISDAVELIKLAFNGAALSFRSAIYNLKDWIPGWKDTTEEQWADLKAQQDAHEQQKYDLAMKMLDNQKKNREDREQREEIIEQQRAERNQKLEEEKAQAYKDIQTKFNAATQEIITGKTIQMTEKQLKEQKALEEEYGNTFGNSMDALKYSIDKESSYLGGKGDTESKTVTPNSGETTSKTQSENKKEEDEPQQGGAAGGSETDANNKKATSDDVAIMYLLNTNMEELVRLTRAQLNAQNKGNKNLENMDSDVYSGF